MNQSIQAARWDDQRRRAVANSRNKHQHQDERNKLVRIHICNIVKRVGYFDLGFTIFIEDDTDLPWIDSLTSARISLGRVIVDSPVPSEMLAINCNAMRGYYSLVADRWHMVIPGEFKHNQRTIKGGGR